MDELWLVVMVCPASIGPTEAHLFLVIMGDAQEVVVRQQCQGSLAWWLGKEGDLRASGLQIGK